MHVLHSILIDTAQNHMYFIGMAIDQRIYWDEKWLAYATKRYTIKTFQNA